MNTCVCPSVHVWTETKKHISYDHLCPSAHVWAVRSYKTPLLWLFFGTVGTFVAILFICSHTKPIATQEKRHPNLWTKVATRHRFVGLDIQTQPHKTQYPHRKKAPKFMDKSSHKTPFCGSVRPSVRRGFRAFAGECLEGMA